MDSAQSPEIQRSGVAAGTSNVQALEQKGQDVRSEEPVGGEDRQGYCCYEPTASKSGDSIVVLRRKLQMPGAGRHTANKLGAAYNANFGRDPDERRDGDVRRELEEL